MVTTVLTPQDCLRDPFTNRGSLLSTPPRTKIRRNPNPTTLISPAASKHGRGQSNSSRRKRSPNSSPPPRPTSDSPSSSLSPQAAAAKILAMGPVKILKRGEEIQKISNKKIESPVEVGSLVKVNQKVEMKLDLVGSLPSTLKKPVIIRIGASPVLNTRSVGGTWDYFFSCFLAWF